MIQAIEFENALFMVDSHIFLELIQTHKEPFQSCRDVQCWGFIVFFFRQVDPWIFFFLLFEKKVISYYKRRVLAQIHFLPHFNGKIIILPLKIVI